MGSPKSSVVLTRLTGSLAALVATWFTADEEGRRRLDASFYGVHPKWWRIVEQDTARYGWVGLLDDEGIGFVDLEVHGGQGSLTIYVRQEFRQRGFGVTSLRLAALEARAVDVTELVGHVENGYDASIRCVRAAGFSQTGVDDYGPVFTMRLTAA